MRKDSYGNSYQVGIHQFASGGMVVAARGNGKAGLATAAAYMQARYGSPALAPWQFMVLDAFDAGDGQDGFVMKTDDGDIWPVPLPAEDGSGYSRGGIPAGTITAARLASGVISISQARVSHSLPPLPPPLVPAPNLAAQQQNAAQVQAAFGVPPALTGPVRTYARGMDGFDGKGKLPGTPGLPPVTGDDQPAGPDPGLDLAGGGEIPDVFGVVRGYRWWTLDAPPLRESPAHADEVWPRKMLRGMQDHWGPGENVAVCRAGYRVHEESALPDISCGCGFWAYWHLQRHEVGGSALPVCGVIEGYGAVLIGEKGFRAAKARIVALHLPFTIQPVTEADDDPMGLGLPKRDQPRTPSGYSPRTPSGQRNPWWNHPQFPGRVHTYAPSGYDDMDDDLAGLARPQPVPDLSEPSAEERQAARDAAEAWMAVIGDRLAQVYPDAKVFETRAAMEAEFPPDESYGPRPVCPECGGHTNGDLAAHLRHECTA